MIHHIKSKPIRTEDGRDNLIGMVMKSFHAPNAPRSSNSVRKDEYSKQINDQNETIPEFKALKCSGKKRDLDPVERKKVKQAVHTVGKNSTKEANLLTKQKNNFVCKFCCHPFRSSELLEQHRLTHGSKPDYVCHVCNHQVATFSALMCHYLRHSGTKNDKLKKTQAKNKSETSNVQSNIPSHSKPKFQCPQCKEYFINKDKFNVHISACKKKIEYNCAYCGHMSPSVEEYRNHVQSHTVSPFSCRHCKFKAQTKKQLDKHYETCKEQVKWKENVTVQCGACKIVCKNKKEITEHMKTCSELKNRNEHQNFKHLKPKNNFKTAKPKKLVLKIPTKNKSSVKVTKPAEIKEYINETKNQSTDQSETLKKGTKISEEKSDVLESCKKTDLFIGTTGDNTSDAQNSIDSTRRSARLVGRRCSFLEDDFDIKRSFKMKAKILNKVKKQKILNKCKGKRGRKPKIKEEDSNDFFCSECKFSFCSKSTLLRHQRMHSGDPWYTCKYCGKFFFRKDVYIRHEVNVHTKIVENVFRCYYCKMYFNLSSLLKEHVLAEHKQSAFMPVKLRRPSKNKNLLKKIPVKEEPLSDDIKNESNKDLSPTKNHVEVGLKSEKKSIKMSNSILVQNTNKEFKCGVCLKLFANNDDIEHHMLIHNESAIFHKNLEVNIPSYPEENSYPILKKEVETPSKYNLQLNIQESVSCEETCDNMSPPELMKQNIESENDDADNCSFEIKENSSMRASEETSEFFCVLCLQQFRSKELLSQHKDTNHKIIDWYQCVVCSFCGPQQDVIEHMFMHMYKVGTFVISGDNYDPLLPHLAEKQPSEIPKCSSDANKTLVATDLLSVESSIEPNLPPLKEFGYFAVTSKTSHDETNHNSKSSQSTLNFSQSTEESISVSHHSLNDEEIISTSLQKDSIKPILELNCSNYDDESIENSPKKLEDTSKKCTEAANVKICAENLVQDITSEFSIAHAFPESSEQNSEKQHVLKINDLNNTEKFTESKLVVDKLSMPNSSIESSICNSKQNIEKFVFPSRNEKEIAILSEQGPDKFLHDTNKKIIDNSCSSPNKSNNDVKKMLALKMKQKKIQSVHESIVSPKKSSDKEDTSFSHLRYLLENFRSDEKSRETQDLQPQTESPSKHSPLKKILLNKSFENVLKNSPTQEQKHLSPSISDNSSCIDMRINNIGALPALAIEETKNANRCLKFDINQSRGEFSETSSCAGNQKPADSFKPNPTHTMLDFSNLLENTTSNENIFECHTSSYPNLTTDFPQQKTTKSNILQSSSSTKRDQILDQPLDFSRENSQCILDYSKHNLQTAHSSAEIKSNRNLPKNNFFSKKTEVETLDNVEKNRQSQNFSTDVISNKTAQLPTEIDELDEMDLSDGIYDNLPTNAKCSMCHQNFNDINELMRHTPTCFKPAFCEKQSSNTLQPSDTLRSLLEKSNSNFPDKIDFAHYYNTPYGTVSNLVNENIKNLSKNS